MVGIYAGLDPFSNKPAVQRVTVLEDPDRTEATCLALYLGIVIMPFSGQSTQHSQFLLEQVDRSYLQILLECGPTPLGVLSSKLSLPALTVQRVIEPYLIKEGFVTKGRSSLRTITEKGKNHIRSTSIASGRTRTTNENITRK